MCRFLMAWLLANIVPALPLIALEIQTLLLLESSADEDRAGLLALSGIVLFLFLLAAGNWLFMRYRGVQPIAWGAMTIIGAAFGLVVAGMVGVFAPDMASKWYFATADDLIDSPLPPSQMTGLFVAGGAGIAFGFGLGLFQAMVLPFPMLSRLAWLAVSILAAMSAFVAAFLLDLAYESILELMRARVSSDRLWFWSPRIAAEVVAAILIYALPTGFTLFLQMRRAARLRPGAWVDRFD